MPQWVCLTRTAFLCLSLLAAAACAEGEEAITLRASLQIEYGL